MKGGLLFITACVHSKSSVPPLQHYDYFIIFICLVVVFRNIFRKHRGNVRLSNKSICLGYMVFKLISKTAENPNNMRH